jgi:hypothetical protein
MASPSIAGFAAHCACPSRGRGGQARQLSCSVRWAGLGRWNGIVIAKNIHSMLAQVVIWFISRFALSP